MRGILKIAPLLLSTAFIGHGALFRSYPLPPPNNVLNNKVETMPEIEQDPKKKNCTPIAFANAMIWLDDNGYSRLITESANLPESRENLVHELELYMRTDTSGTNRLATINGLINFFKDKGYEPKVEYANFGFLNNEHVTDSFGNSYSSNPNLDFIEEGTQDLSNIILSLSEFTYDPKEKKYLSTWSHSVTVARAIRLDPNTLDIEVKDGLKEVGKLRLTYLRDHNRIHSIYRSLSSQVREDETKGIQFIQCKQLDNRSKEHPDKILLVWNATSFRIIER